ncbi:MAG TPA: GNAT family N-acetyltransferase [Ktedonobacteraceae bacterium]|nr:GNAT family N-acetyltransferase [Ktedonobacteraceae bacterium]
MLRQRISVQPLRATDIPQIVELIQAQFRRQDAIDPRLHLSRSASDLNKMLQAQLEMSDNQPLVAHDAEGRVRGYVLPAYWELEPDEEMISFFTARNGTCQYWTLPAPTDADALPVTEAMLDALTAYWQSKQTYGDLLRWPANDLWLEPLLFARGFLSDNLMALRPLDPLPPSKHPTPPGYHARLARPEDEDALVRLHHDELAFHLPYTPFVRLVPALETAFRKRLAQAWEGIAVEDGAPLVIVIEHEQEVVAMSENELLIVENMGGFRLMPPGRYGYLNNVSVSEKTRGQGIGRLLVEATFQALSRYDIDAYILWYSQDNPRASGFWPHMGFRPLWKTHQRHNRSDGIQPMS